MQIVRFFGLVACASLFVSHAWSQGAAPNATANAQAYVGAGEADGAKGDLDGAITAFDQAIKIDPSYAPAYYNRGLAHSLQQNLDAAMSDYNQAILLDPKYEVAYSNRGAIRARKGDFDGAIADFSRAIDLDPKYAVAYYNLGHAKYFKADLDGAMQDLNKSVDLDPKSSFTYYIRGLVRRAQDDREGATADFQESVSAGFSYGAFWLWIVQTEAGDKGIANATLSNNVNKPNLFKPDDWPSLIANFLLGKVTQDQLMDKANAAVGSKDPLCEAWFFVGMVKHFSGDDKGALESFHRAIDTGAVDSEESIEARSELTKLDQP